jgi:signal transduction histidine kinase
VLFVKDQGEGIPDEHKQRIFSRFERLGKEGVQGSGLGLTITKQIVSLHRGEIWVEDNPSGGSAFFVRVPKSATAG